MAHVAFCIAPFTGHVNPSLAAVSELVRRGHRVSYATTAEFARTMRGAGADVVEVQTTMAMPPGGRAARAAPGGDELVHACRGQLRELESVTPVLLAAFGDDVPDVVICDPMSWAGPVLAARWRVPAVTTVTSMISNARWSLGPVGATFRPDHPALPLLLAATSAALARYQSGLTADRLLGIGSQAPVIAYFPRAFQYRGDAFGPNVEFAGPCLPSRRAAAAPGKQAWAPSGDGPVVLLSLGTVFNRQPALFRRCLDALADTGYQVVAALGGLDAAELGPLPPNARAHTQLPLPAVLPDADVFIGHGGMTSTMEALSYGVPVAALPQTPEQRLNAARLAELGLGRCLELDQQTGPALRKAVEELRHDTSVRNRLDWMRSEIERAPGAAAAADVIENAIRECHGARQPT
jgi:MGT family glycosyltransferase